MTAAEIANLNLSSMPTSERGINMIAADQNWRASSLARKRSGRGGGWEYNIALLPQAAIHEICRIEQAQAHDRKKLALKEAAKAEVREAAPQMNRLTARQREVMEARAALLLAVDSRVLTTAGTRSKAIDQLIEELTAMPDTDVEELRAVCQVACERKTIPSRRQLYDWLKARDELGLAGLAPRPKRERNALPDWFEGWLPHFARPAKPTIADALETYRKTLPDPSKAPSYDQVRRALAKLGPLEQAAGREGKLAMRSRLAYVQRDTSDLLPTSVYVGDGKTFDAEIAHPIHGQPFRPEITSIIDAATRVCVGFSADIAEKTFAVAEALRHACADYGIPALFYTDRGSGYISKGMVGTLARDGPHGPISLASELIEAELAVPYDGGTKRDWCRLPEVPAASDPQGG